MFGFVGDPTPDYAQMRAHCLCDPACSTWLRNAIEALDARDPVDAVNDTEVLLQLGQARLEDLMTSMRQDQ